MISVITPVYKIEENQLRECLDSFCHQDDLNIEYICIDDGSPDHCGDILDEYALKDPRIHVIHKNNGGVCAARNDGLKQATGDYILFVDGDDYLADHAIDQLIEYTKQYPNQAIFYQYTKLYNTTPIVIPYTDKNLLTYQKGCEQEFNIYDMRIMSYITHTLFPREIIEGIFFDPKLKMCEDILFNFQAYERIEKAIYINQSLYYYRVNITSAVRKYDPKVYSLYEATIDEVAKLSLTGKALNAYYSLIGVTYNNMILNNIFNDHNPESLITKMKDMKELSKQRIYQEMFDHIQLIDLPKSRQIFIRLNHAHLYLITYLIVRFKKMQDHSRAKKGIQNV